jgi:hypothetical protein
MGTSRQARRVGERKRGGGGGKESKDKGKREETRKQEIKKVEL